jgi:hypothetical protein
LLLLNPDVFLILSFLYICQYLSDLVVCNHMLLQSLEDMPSNPEYSGPPFHMVEHIAQFANTGPQQNTVGAVASLAG